MLSWPKHLTGFVKQVQAKRVRCFGQPNMTILKAFHAT